MGGWVARQAYGTTTTCACLPAPPDTQSGSQPCVRKHFLLLSFLSQLSFFDSVFLFRTHSDITFRMRISMKDHFSNGLRTKCFCEKCISVLRSAYLEGVLSIIKVSDDLIKMTTHARDAKLGFLPFFILAHT